MGQQQLLLIVLGVIIVGIAIVVGINLFNASAVQANRDGVVADLTNLSASAQQYYKKPTALGGGGLSFVGYTIPDGLSSNPNGTFAIASAAAGQLVINGTGTELNDAGEAVQHQATITPTGTTVIMVK